MMDPRERAGIIRHWLKSGVVADDEAAAARQMCEFPSGFVSCVSVSTAGREYSYLAKYDAAGNDNRERRCQFEGLVK